MSWRKVLLPLLILPTLLLGLSACESEKASFQSASLKPPVTGESFAPRLSADEEQLLLSWLAVTESGEHALRFARYQNQEWSPVGTVAQGENWFANWADTPGVRPVGDWLFAHWLVRSGPGTYDYDIHAAWSPDQGDSWTEPFILHRDGVQAEHGFLSSVVLPDGDLGMAWLDGRQTANDGGGSDARHHGDMSLRWTRLSPGQSTASPTQMPSQLLDERVCDCCMTATVMDEQGPLVFYRDRSQDEIRDIAWRRPPTEAETEAQGVAGARVMADDWEIAACPVNGPSAVRSGGAVGVAWFTAAQQHPRVLFSHQQGREFSPAKRLDDGQALGRTALSDWPGGGWLAVWMERREDDTHLRARLLNEGAMQPARTLAVVSGSRQSGFPVSVRREDSVFVAWTDVDEQGKRTLRMLTLSPEDDL